MSKIITIDDLQSYSSGVTLDDALGQQIVDGINGYIERQTGRCFGETKSVTERYNWTNVLWLRHTDLISVDAMSLGWPGQTSSPIVSSGYYFNPLGRVTLYSTGGRTMSRLYNDYLSISYTYGYTGLGLDEADNPIVPDDLKMAALKIAGAAYNWAVNGNRNVQSISVGSYRIEYMQRRPSSSPTGSPSDQAAIDGDIGWQVIDSYRMRRV